MVDLATGTEAIDFLIDGARYGDMDDVEIALDQYKVGVDATDEQQRTALHMASANGHAEIVEFLLSRGANPDAANEQQNTPLHWACLNGKAQVIKLLMDKGASASAVNSQGRTPVDEALGRPYQDEVLAIVNSYGKVTDRLDDNDDPESGEYEMEEQNLEAGNESDPELKPYKYDKYGTG